MTQVVPLVLDERIMRYVRLRRVFLAWQGGDIGSDGKGYEPRPVITELANGIVDERETNRESPVITRAPEATSY